jgi:penicillin V acylase-like amidase (Ntn superfamily)
MKTLSSLFLLTLLLTIPLAARALACSTFVLQNGDLQVFGRNYDWSLDDALLVVNKRGCRKRSVYRPEETAERAMWTAQYGSITFNQYGRELPTGGINEAGLVVETMALPEARYPKPDHRPYIGAALQWRQYLLDTCATVADVLAADRSIRISNDVKGPGMHVLILDNTGDRAAIEFLDGHMTVHRGDDLPVAVLTNDTYARSLQCLGEGHPPTFDPYSSITRFITAAKRVQRCRAASTSEMVAFAFDTLAAVASGRTQWRIVYDNQAMMVYYRTRANFRLRHIDVSGLDFSPATPVKILDVNAGISGDVTGHFSNYTYEANRDLIGRTFRKTSFLSGTPDERLNAIARFPESFTCRQE